MRMRRGTSPFVIAGACTALLLPIVASPTTRTIPVGTHPTAVATNSVTNKIYVANFSANTVTVINGNTGLTATVPTGTYPTAVAVNQLTDKIYVANQGSDTVTVIDGVTNAAFTLPVGAAPIKFAINAVTNQTYVGYLYGASITVIDGFTYARSLITTGSCPCAPAVNEITNTIYVANASSNTVSVIEGVTRSTRTVRTGVSPEAVAVNPATNKVYVANFAKEGTVTVIDGVSDATVTIPTSPYPVALAVSLTTNNIYVASDVASGIITAIDGSSGSTTTFAAGSYPIDLALNPSNDTIYVANRISKDVTIFNPATGSRFTVPAGKSPTALAINAITNSAYVTNYADNTVTAIDGTGFTPLRYVPLTPCRVVDTRRATGPFGGPAIAGQRSRDFAFRNSSCGIPKTAAAYSLNVTVVPHGSLGFLTAWATGTGQPRVSTLNSIDGRIKSVAAILPGGAGGAISIFASMDRSSTTDVVLDINGYFVPATDTTGLAFFPTTPCRVMDTRNPIELLGGPYLHAEEIRHVPVLQSNCNLPADAQAYSLNFTAIPKGLLYYLTVWPAGQPRPGVSTLNALTGALTANAAVVLGDANGTIDVFSTNDTDLVIDVNGYFAPASTGTGPQSLYATTPCRVLDTRQTTGTFEGSMIPPVNVSSSACGISGTAQAVVLNATVVPAGALGYLTLWPQGQIRPKVSSLNAMDGAVTNNMAIVPLANGSIEVFGSNPTNLVLDAFGFFAQ